MAEAGGLVEAKHRQNEVVLICKFIKKKKKLFKVKVQSSEPTLSPTSTPNSQVEPTTLNFENSNFVRFRGSSKFRQSQKFETFAQPYVCLCMWGHVCVGVSVCVRACAC